MITEDKERLLNLLAGSHSDVHATVEGIDLELPVHSDTGWRIREIVGHLAIWDREVVKSIRAFQAGTEYSIPDLDEDAFNREAASAQHKLTAQQVLAEWDNARDDFITAVEELSPDQLHGEFLYPWGDERGNIVLLVEYMVEHDAEHRDEIVKAIEASRKA